MLIKIWCLPDVEEEKLNAVFKDVVKVVTEIPESGITSQNDMMVLFPKDMMKYGLGMDIAIEVTGLYPTIKDDEFKFKEGKLFNDLAKKLSEAVQKHFPKAEWVKCFVYDFNHRSYACCKPVRLIPVSELLKQGKISAELHSRFVDEKINCLHDIDIVNLLSTSKFDDFREEIKKVLAI